VLSRDRLFTPETLQRSGRPTLFVQAGIHAGEIDGKDAGLMFLFLAGLGYIVVKEEERRGDDKRLHPIVVNRFRRLARLQALPIFWVSTPVGILRFLLWSSPFIILTIFRKPKPEAKTITQ